MKRFRVVAGRLVYRPVEQRAEFQVFALTEAEARVVAAEIAADEDRNAMWVDHDRDHDEVETVRLISVEPVAMKPSTESRQITPPHDAHATKATGGGA
jgi:hypothetical protein